MTKYNKFFVTGGYGFIGSCLVRKLLNSKENQVVNIDKMTYASNELAVEDVHEGYKHYKKDINDIKFLNTAFNNYKPECVIHLAAESHVDRSIDSPGEFINTNILGTYNLLNASYNYWLSLDKDEKENFRFIHVSTDEVYGDADTGLVFNESSPYLPNSPYAASKASSDLLVRSWYKTFRFPVIITNSSNNYGKWQFPEKLIPLTIKKILLEEKIPIYGDGKQIRDWIHVEDHIDGLLMVLNKGNLGENYNISTAIETTNISLVEKICSILNDIYPSENVNDYKKLISLVKDRPGHDLRYSVDNNKIVNELNWSPKFNLKEGIVNTIKWYIDHKEWLLDDKKLTYDGRRLGTLKQ